MHRHSTLLLSLLALFIVPRAAESPDRTSSPTELVAASATCPSVCFCDETHYVSCVGDGLWQVPTDIPATVTRLELRNYAMGTLPSRGLLAPLLHLIEIKFQQTQIASIENSIFGNLTRLLRLDVSDNVLERVSSATFEGLTSLRYLDLSSNRLSQVDEAFVDLVNLEQLNLRDNFLPELTSHTFIGLYKLQYLNLDSNNLSSIEVGTFQYMTNLAHLIVSNNPLTTLSRLDFFGSRLQYIDVSRVELQRVPQSLTRYVRDLRLAKNNLTHVRLGDFDSYPYLSLLVLDDNRLIEIENDALGRLEFLVRLWLNGNRLQQIPANLPSSLRVLYIEENVIPKLSSDSFQGLYNLEQLFLKRNQIKVIESETFADLISLTHLDLQANLIESVAEGTFFNLTSLLSLDLSQNPLKTIVSGSFIGLDSLKTLLLSRIKVLEAPVRFDGAIFDPLKRLETLEVFDSPALAPQLVNSTRALQGLRNLRELNLMNNNLESLRADFPHFFPQLKVAKLSGNQWNCDRNLFWFTSWLTKSDTHFYHSYGIRCSRPQNLIYKPIAMLKEEDVQVQPTTTTPPSTKPTTITTIIITSSTTTTTTTTTTTKPPTTSSNPPTTTEALSTTLSTDNVSTVVNLENSTDFNANVTNIYERLTTIDESVYNTENWVNLTETSPPIVATTPSVTTTAASTTTTISYNHAIERRHDNESLVAAISIFTGFALLFLGISVTFLLFRCHKGQNALSRLNCIMRRSSSSISYSPHRDEVSIVTVSDGTVGLTTATHQGLSNKLYFVLENGSDPNSRDQVTKAALPDPSLRELLPTEHHTLLTTTPQRMITTKSTNTYCFT